MDPRFARVLWIWVCPSVRPSVCKSIFYHSIFLRIIGSLVFFIFCIKLRDHKYSILTEPNFFGKILASPKMGQNGTICPSIFPLRQHCSQDWVSIFVIVYLFYLFIYLFFWYFAWSWGTISTQNSRSQVFWDNFCLP